MNAQIERLFTAAKAVVETSIDVTEQEAAVIGLKKYGYIVSTAKLDELREAIASIEGGA